MRRPKPLLACAAIGLLAIGAAIATVSLSSESDSDGESGNPHINLSSGSTNGVPPETRVGIRPPALPDMSMKEAARVANCKLRLGLPDDGHDHLPPTAPGPQYGTNPPNSGPHLEHPYQQADGAYRKTPPAAAVVSSLEHGRLAIQYRPDIGWRAERGLIGHFETIFGGTLLFPDPDLRDAVVATTWTNQLSCPFYFATATHTAIQTFGRATWGRYGGEPVAGLQPGSPTPRSAPN